MKLAERLFSKPQSAVASTSIAVPPADPPVAADSRLDARYRSMLENVPLNVIMADRDLKIVYVNPASLQTLKTLEKHLPIRAEDVLGQSIDRFHRDPSVQRRLLSDPRNLPHRAVITLGPEKLELNVSAVYDGEGRYQGPMVTWGVVTERLRIEEDVARMVSMVENAPANIMYADRELVVRYANPAALRTLQKLQAHLPVKVDRLIGTCIDRFHRDPSVQRRLLADPANLPHRVQIRLGPETLELLVSAVKGRQGEYLGAMVTWEVITEKLASERSLAEAAERERVATEELRRKVDEILSVVRAAAEGDLTRTVTVSGTDAIGGLGEGLGRFLADLRGKIAALAGDASAVSAASEELSAVSRELTGNAEETAGRATTAAAAAEQVNRNLHTVAAASEEMNASIREIAKSASDAARIAGGAVRAVERSNELVAKLGASGAEIGEVVKVISVIAGQTNLLALNATIEAARAGEAGRGFAVVAGEVKELAKAVAKATEDIERKIQTIQTDTRGAVEAIQQIGGIVKQINDIQTTIAGAVEEQTATTNEISRNVTEAAKGSGEIASNVAGVASNAEETKTGSEGARQAALDLARRASALQALVGAFKY
jgi:methyl-accepting chemotaxis protein